LEQKSEATKVTPFIKQYRVIRKVSINELRICGSREKVPHRSVGGGHSKETLCPMSGKRPKEARPQEDEEYRNF
jgi:hypothetical protein